MDQIIEWPGAPEPVVVARSFRGVADDDIRRSRTDKWKFGMYAPSFQVEVAKLN